MTTPTEERLREALGTLADHVRPSPDAYRRTQATWRRRERRRRLTMIIVTIVIVGVADLVGLWALRHAQQNPSMIFDAPAPVVVQDLSSSGAPPPQPGSAPQKAGAPWPFGGSGEDTARGSVDPLPVKLWPR